MKTELIEEAIDLKNLKKVKALKNLKESHYNFMDYLNELNKRKIYIVIKDNKAKLLNLNKKECCNVIIKEGTTLRKLRTIPEKRIYEMYKSEYPNLRFYIYARFIKWYNKKEVQEYMKEWTKERKLKRLLDGDRKHIRDRKTKTDQSDN